MDYNKILSELNGASLFELYRLNGAIWKQLDDPDRNQLIKRQLRVGQEITYFNIEENRLIEAVILDVKRTRASVRDLHGGRGWSLPFYQINIDCIDTEIQHPTINRNTLKVGDHVCFSDKEGEEFFGQVSKLNPKTAGIMVGTTQWRVAYNLLSPVLDGALDTNLVLEEDNDES